MQKPIEAKREKEDNAFASIKSYLLKKGCRVDEKEIYEPFGKSIFPDYSVNIDDNLTYLEITSSGKSDIISENQLYEDETYGTGAANFLKNITVNVSKWLPPDYTLFIFMSGPVMRKEGRSHLARELSSFLNLAFEKNILIVKDFAVFSNDLMISKAIFILGAVPPLKMKIPGSNVIIDFGGPDTKERVYFSWSSQVNSPERGTEIKRLISKKEQKLLNAIDKNQISNDADVWLIIINDGDGFDFWSYRLAFNCLLNDGFNPLKNFKKILILIKEREGECVYEVVQCKENEKLIMNILRTIVKPTECNF